MSKCLSFTEDFYTGGVDYFEVEPSDRPTSLIQAIISLPREVQIEIAREIFGIEDPGEYVDGEDFPLEVLDRCRTVDRCDDYESPVTVYIEEEGFFSVMVYR